MIIDENNSVVVCNQANSCPENKKTPCSHAKPHVIFGTQACNVEPCLRLLLVRPVCVPTTLVIVTDEQKLP